MINRIFMLIMVFSLCHAQVAISGGIQKEVDLHQSVMISDWDGLYGQVVLGVGANVSYNVTGGNISRLDLIAQEPPQCNGTPEVLMHIVAVNASSVVPPLQPGNIPVLDAAIPGHDNGSDSFINTSSFDLTYGNFTLVPALFTFAANNSPAFPEGYFNDAEGNLVFVADVVSDQPDWNGSISDYQLMLPKNGTGYSIFADAIYSCVSNNNPPGPTHKFHRLYIAPPPQQPIQIIAGTPSDLVFSVQDIGNFPESAINLTMQCPAGFSCGSGSISSLQVGGKANSSIPITANNPGEYVLTVCAADAGTSVCREFLLFVSAQCSLDRDCQPLKFCQSGLCLDKKNLTEQCGGGDQCLSGFCPGGTCVDCIEDSDCPDSQMCSAGTCVNVKCDCGKVSDHSCAAYACCSDSDCGKCQICSGNSCEGKRFDIMLVGLQGALVEGQPVQVQVLGNDGHGVPNAHVFTNGSDTHADPNGYATIDAPYDGIIYASADCYPNAGVMFTIMKVATFVVPQNIFVGTEAAIKISDSHGLPVTGATVSVDGQIFTTDSNGVFRRTFDSPGKINISAVKDGYSISRSELTVNVRPPGSYPELSFDNATLGTVSISLALLNFFIFRRRLNVGPVLQLVYYFGPLMIAMTPGTAYGLGAALDVSIVQLVIELLTRAFTFFKK